MPPTTVASTLEDMVSLYERLTHATEEDLQALSDAIIQRYGIKAWDTAVPADMERIEALTGMLRAYINARKSSY